MTTLREIVTSETAAAEELPLVHTTRCEILPYIVATHELRSAKLCEVFHEHLVYFFYGRPAYRVARAGNPRGDLDLCPVCFVFKPHTIGASAKRVFPCDTGALDKNSFVQHLSANDRNEIELDATLDSARKLVTLIFGDNSRYYAGEAKALPPVGFAPGTPAGRFHALLTDATAGAGDDRRSAIEVQMDSPVALDHHLLYVILPMDKLNEPEVREAILRNWQTDPIGYQVTKFRPPNEYRTLIGHLLEERYKQGGRL